MRVSALVLSNGATGAEKQALALARACAHSHSLLTIRNPLRRLPTSLQLCAPASLTGFSPCLPPHPSVAISCGRATVPASIALRRHTAGATLTVHVQTPPCDPRLFDLIVAPRHDLPEEAVLPPNLIRTEGSLHDITSLTLDQARAAWHLSMACLPSPRVALLVGGSISRRPWQRPLGPTLDASLLRGLVEEASQVGA